MLTRSDVARLLGPTISPSTVSKYLTESQPGSRADGTPYRYADHPFPAPDGRIGSAPWWKPERADEIRAWAAARAGQGAGGGPSRRMAELRQWWARLDEQTQTLLLDAARQPHPPESVHAALVPVLPAGQTAVASGGFGGDMQPIWPRGLKRFLAQQRIDASKESA